MLRFTVTVMLLACFHGYDHGVLADDAALELTEEVQTESGPIQGMVKVYNGSAVNQYIGIPFAEPPVGNLRFQKPMPVDSWNETLQATEHHASCFQNIYDNDRWLVPLAGRDLSEDCLHLNVFVPNATDNTGPKAVMVWIHGGGFTNGMSSMYDGSYLALQGDVIVVTINYRLGMLGFMSTEDENAPGNYGLWDQALAIKWVSDNIHAFGGDNTRVCIFGESAGGYSVGLHTIIPKNKGHFQRAISESGTAYTDGAVLKDSRFVAIRAAELLDCPTNVSSKAMVDCIRSKPASEVLAIQTQAAEGYGMDPIIDGDLITDHPVNLFTDTQSEAYAFFKSLDVMAGTNNGEGGLRYWAMMSYEDKYNFTISDGIPREVLCDEVAPQMAADSYHGNTDIADGICSVYDVPAGNMEELGRATLNIFGDTMFIIPTVKTVETHATSAEPQGSTTYHYIFTHEPSFPWIQDRPPWLDGANHADEEPFVFGLDAMYPADHARPEDELFLAEQMMTYWANFAKTGNPNGDMNDSLPFWPEYEPETKGYMNLTVNPTSGEQLYSDRVTFWMETVPGIVASLNPPAGAASTVGDKPHVTVKPGSHGQTKDNNGVQGGKMCSISVLLLAIIAMFLLL